MTVHFQHAQFDDAEVLASIRVMAMKPSLEALGRFDPARARERFLSTFIAADTHLMVQKQRILGFYVLRREIDHLFLDHLYLHPDHQSNGLGSRAIEHVKDISRQENLPVKLGALRNSLANAFYTNRGFSVEKEEEWDIYYTWHPDN